MIIRQAESAKYRFTYRWNTETGDTTYDKNIQIKHKVEPKIQKINLPVQFGHV